MTISQGSDLQVSEAYLITISMGGVISDGTLDVRSLHRFDRKDAEGYATALGIGIQMFLQRTLCSYGSGSVPPG